MPLVNKTFSDIITFSRASSATMFDSSGTLVYAPMNAIRNNTGVGAVAGTPGTVPTNWSVSSAGGLSREVVGSGTINGINYIDIRIFGTTTNASLALNVYFDAATQIAALNGQTWTNSLWAQIVGGSITGISQIYLAMVELNAGGSDLAYLSGIDFKSTIGTFSRRIYTAATTNASTAFIRPGLWVNSTGIGAVIDITFRIGLPQLELGAFATSVIPTTTTSLTRSADAAAVNTLSPWYNATEGTIFVEASPQASNVASILLTDLNTAVTDRISLAKLITSGNASLAVLVASVTQVSTNSGPWTATGKFAGAYKLNDFASSLNGSAAATDTSGTIPAVTQLFLGRRADGANILNGYLRRVTYYPRRLSDAELQAITA